MTGHPKQSKEKQIHQSHNCMINDMLRGSSAVAKDMMGASRHQSSCRDRRYIMMMIMMMLAIPRQRPPNNRCLFYFPRHESSCRDDRHVMMMMMMMMLANAKDASTSCCVFHPLFLKQLRGNRTCSSTIRLLLLF
jgi:hypothetical protein